jgi:hypothetical protein
MKFDSKRMAVKAAAFVTRSNIGETVCRLEGELLEDFDHG